HPNIVRGTLNGGREEIMGWNAEEREQERKFGMAARTGCAPLRGRWASNARRSTAWPATRPGVMGEADPHRQPARRDAHGKRGFGPEKSAILDSSSSSRRLSVIDIGSPSALPRGHPRGRAPADLEVLDLLALGGARLHVLPPAVVEQP